MLRSFYFSQAKTPLIVVIDTVSHVSQKECEIAISGSGFNGIIKYDDAKIATKAMENLNEFLNA